MNYLTLEEYIRTLKIGDIVKVHTSAWYGQTLLDYEVARITKAGVLHLHSKGVDVLRFRYNGTCLGDTAYVSMMGTPSHFIVNPYEKPVDTEVSMLGGD